MSRSPTVLDVRGLRVCRADGRPIVDGIDLQIRAGEILGLVGESGAGKSTTLLALLGHRAPGLRYTFDGFQVAGQHVDVHARRRRAGDLPMAFVPQNPGRSLNPSMRVGQIISDCMRRGERGRGVDELLEIVGLGADPRIKRRFPHQLSGGQQQRVCIAAALAVSPEVIVLDEPTTGLDVITQSRILDELRRLRSESGVAMIYVTHDLSVVAQVADQLAVLYAGRVVESGETGSLLTAPRHPYTRGLLDATPDHLSPTDLRAMPGFAAAAHEWADGCAFGPRCSRRVTACGTAPDLEDIGPGRQVRCVNPDEASRGRTTAAMPRTATTMAEDGALRVSDLVAVHESRQGPVPAVRGVDFSVRRGECVALLGESGSGKTTTARVIAGLHRAEAGAVMLNGVELAAEVGQRTQEQRQAIQMVYQNATEALNPSQTALTSVRRAVEVFQKVGRREAADRASSALQMVGLPGRVHGRYPAELSGGERQRVAVARAIAAEPEVLICDEITSALDVSVQAAIWELLGKLRRELGLSMLVVTHDLGVVADMADRAVVLRHGAMVERSDVAALLADPQHPYTQNLLAAAPSLSRPMMSP